MDGVAYKIIHHLLLYIIIYNTLYFYCSLNKNSNINTCNSIHINIIIIKNKYLIDNIDL